MRGVLRSLDFPCRTGPNPPRPRRRPSFSILRHKQGIGLVAPFARIFRRGLFSQQCLVTENDDDDERLSGPQNWDRERGRRRFSESCAFLAGEKALLCLLGLRLLCSERNYPLPARILFKSENSFGNRNCKVRPTLKQRQREQRVS